MKKDRFDQFYMLQTSAKALEKKNKPEEALNIYIEIIENYFPDTDYTFVRAVSLLKDKGKYEQCKTYCQLAIDRIKDKEMRGDYTFFYAVLKELENKEEAPKKDFNPLKDFDVNKHFKPKTVAAIIYVIIAVLLSLPFKVYKFLFIIALGLSLILLYEIIKRIKQNLKFNLQIIALFSALIMAMGSASMLPPPEWTNFFALQPLTQIGVNQVSTAKPSETKAELETEANKEEATKISESDLETLEKIKSGEQILDSYDIWVEGDTIFLTLFAKNSAKDHEIKSVAESILKELNAIKAKKSNNKNRLGDLYKEYQAKIAVYDQDGNPKFNGLSSRHTLKIKW